MLLRAASVELWESIESSEEVRQQTMEPVAWPGPRAAGQTDTLTVWSWHSQEYYQTYNKGKLSQSPNTVTTQSYSLVEMSFWQENYAFIKDVYDMRHQKMAEWMDNVEKVEGEFFHIWPQQYSFSHYDGETQILRHSRIMLIFEQWRTKGMSVFICRPSPGSWRTRSTPRLSSREREITSMWVSRRDYEYFPFSQNIHIF